MTCQATKAKRRVTGSTHSKKDPKRKHVLSADQLEPGQRVHVDQYISAVRGRLPNTKGREKAAQQYKGGTIFYDSAFAMCRSCCTVLGFGGLAGCTHRGIAVNCA